LILYVVSNQTNLVAYKNMHGRDADVNILYWTIP
jgi:hypothetical protein